MVATIHQPNSLITDHFDDWALLAQGRLLYFGPWEAAVPYFDAAGYVCPMYRYGCSADHLGGGLGCTGPLGMRISSMENATSRQEPHCSVMQPVGPATFARCGCLPCRNPTDYFMSLASSLDTVLDLEHRWKRVRRADSVGSGRGQQWCLQGILVTLPQCQVSFISLHD